MLGFSFLFQGYHLSIPLSLSAFVEFRGTLALGCNPCIPSLTYCYAFNLFNVIYTSFFQSLGQGHCSFAQVMMVCILNRIPVFAVGKPGNSKSLALQILKTNLKGMDSKKERCLFGALPCPRSQIDTSWTSIGKTPQQ